MILNNYGIKNSYTVEIQPAASDTAQTWMFPDIPFLRTKPITGIILSAMQAGVNSGKTNYGYTIWTNTATSAFLTLQDDKGKQFIQNMPLRELFITSQIGVNEAFLTDNYVYGSNTDGIKYIDPRIIVWTKSFVYLPVATGTANLCLQFTVLYNN
jgi:hypothetical protein